MHYSTSTFIYKMYNISLNIVTEHDYLGICFHHKLSWDAHVAWLTHHIKQKMKTRNKIYIRAKCNQNESDWATYIGK